MSYHIVLKLRRRLERDLAIPYWPDFIMDKTGALDSVEPDVTVAVLDTGADVDHVELRGKFAAQADFVDLKSLDTTDFIGDIANPDADAVGHGTHVSGIVTARGIAMAEGVAPDCRLLAVRVLAILREGDQVTGAGIVDNISTGIKWAVDQG